MSVHVRFAPAVLVAVCTLTLGSAAEASGLRGTRDAPLPAVAREATAAATLDRGVWRTGSCDHAGNFQAFSLGAASPAVEVGSGASGQGERLDVLASSRAGDLVTVETRVCAPVGCNRTFEQYRLLDADRMQEWRFEGRLPDQPPYVLVADGRATDGSAGRTFTRCAR